MLLLSCLHVITFVKNKWEGIRPSHVYGTKFYSEMRSGGGSISAGGTSARGASCSTLVVYTRPLLLRAVA